MFVPVLLTAGVIGLLYASRRPGNPYPDARELPSFTTYFITKPALEAGSKEAYEAGMKKVEIGPVMLGLFQTPGTTPALSNPQDPLIHRSTEFGITLGPADGEIVWIAPTGAAVVRLPQNVRNLLGAPEMVLAQPLPSSIAEQL